MARLLKYLMNEEWLMRGESYGGKFDIFMNPTSKDLKEMKRKKIRFTADSRDRNLYVWDAIEAIHKMAWESIKPGENENYLAHKGVLLEGIAELSGGKYRMVSSDQLNTYFYKDERVLEKFREEFNWVNKYININIFMDVEGYW